MTGLGISTFLELVWSKLVAQGWGVQADWKAQQVANKFEQIVSWVPPIPPAPVPTIAEISEDAFRHVTNSRMIHEMLKRGYAVMRVPAQGSNVLDVVEARVDDLG